jgi:hypothetical protein
MIVLEKFNNLEEKFDFQALRYAERYGIIEYTQKEGKMCWMEKYPNEGEFLHTKDFKTGETWAKQIKKAYWE